MLLPVLFDNIALLHGRKLRQRASLFAQVGDREKYPMFSQPRLPMSYFQSIYTSLLLIIHGTIRDNTVLVDVCLLILHVGFDIY